MPAISRIQDYSTGHGCFPPTQMVVSSAVKTFFNGKNPGVVDSGCQFATHTCGTTTHSQSERYPVSGCSKTYVEGFLLARIGDDISCGDVIAEGSYNSFAE